MIKRSLLILLTLSLALAVQASGPTTPLRIGEHDYSQVLETPHPYPGSKSGMPELVWSDYYGHPAAAYVVFEFKEFDLAPGDWVEVKDPKGVKVHRYEGKGFLEQGGAFITSMVPGPEAIVELYSVNAKPGRFGYRIERVTRGFSPEELESLYPSPGPLSICGTDNKKDAVCYQASYPDIYARAKAVARIVMDASALCTAWLVSCENHILTNNHCTWDDSDFDTQGELNRMEFQFMYEDPTCGGSGATWAYSFMGGTWLENDHNLDYTLIQPPAGQNPQATYGYLQIDNRLAAIDEYMYIVGHPSGRPKEISLESTDSTDAGGFCQVYSTNEPVCVGGTVPEIGYMCDTEGGNSGSPVLSRNSNKIISLHHCGTCPNRGLRIQNVYGDIQASAHPLPACTINSYAGTVALDDTQYGCTESLTITVKDDSTPPKGTGSVSVTLWSVAEPTPESIVLVETPINSGTFTGTFPLSPDPAVHGDSVLSVGDGDTVTVRYIDADDGQGGVNIPREDAVPVGCAPDLQHQSHVTTDDCAAGGGGDADGVLDAGETAVIQVTAVNAGTLTATAVSATLSTGTAGVTVTDGTAVFPNIPASGGTDSSAAPHFAIAVGAGVACGTVIDFTLNFTSVEGTWSDAFSITVGVPIAGTFTLVDEDFEGTWGPNGNVPPTGWTITDNGSQSPKVWDANDWYKFAKGGTYASVARVYYSPLENQDEWLVTPAFNIPAAALSAALEYDHYFYVYSAPGEDGYVDFKSDQTPVWTTLAQYSGTTGTSTAYAHASHSLLLHAGETNCQVRFRYVSYDGWYWEVDNVKVSGAQPGGCNMTACVASGPLVQYDPAFDPVASLVQVCGDGDGVVEPGEDWRVTVRLKNAGTSDATGTIASLTINAGSAVAASIQSGNPGAFGTLTSGDGTATADFVFRAAAGAACGNGITFDLTGISSAEKSYPGQSPAFSVPVGWVSAGGDETRTQQTTPLSATGGTANSNLSPAFTLAAADTATLSYGNSYTPGPGPVTTLFGPDDFASAANWTSTGGSLQSEAKCTTATPPPSDSYYRITTDQSITLTNAMSTVGYTNITVRLHGAIQSNGATLYLDWYDGNTWTNGAWSANSTTWQCGQALALPAGAAGKAGFKIRFRAVGGATTQRGKVDYVNITGVGAGTGSWTANARVLLVDPSNAVTVLKAFGAVDGSPYNVQAHYTGPGTYRLRLEENAGGTATVTGGSMNVVMAPTSECDVSACGSTAPPPVNHTGANAARFTKGSGNTLNLTYDAVSCSADKVIVMYGALNDFAGYDGCAQANGGNAGTTTLDGTGHNATWYNLVWTIGTTAGHPGFATSGARLWNANGFCGMAADNNTRPTCP